MGFPSFNWRWRATGHGERRRGVAVQGKGILKCGESSEIKKAPLYKYNPNLLWEEVPRLSFMWGLVKDARWLKVSPRQPLS